MTDWKKLEDEVDKAIKKDCLVNFDSKTMKECKYQQKVAEDILSFIVVQINAIIFVAAVGVSISIAFIRINDLVALTGYFIGMILIVIGVLMVFYIKYRYKRCSRIILDAEKCILSKKDSEEPKQPHEKEDETGKVQ